MKKFIFTIAVLLSAVAVNAKTLVAYYSYTNNVESIVNALSYQIECDVLEIEPAEKGLDYAADNYAIGSAQIAAIRNNPNDASSYPAIDAVGVNMDDYDMVIIACPLWWSQMAAPFQTFLFHYGAQMAGKRIGVIVSSASSGISGIVADAKRLIPDGNFIEPYLWIRSSQTSNAASLITTWLSDIHYNDLTSAVSSITADKGFDIVASDGVITVNGSFNTLSLYNLSGNRIFDTSDNHVNISAFPSGVYIAQANNGKESVTRKINVR